MYSLKLAHLIKEKLPDAKVSEYYIDMRAFGKGYEEFYERIKSEGIDVIRGKTAQVEEKDGKLLLRSEDIINQRIIEDEVDMVVLAVGLEPRDDTKKLAEMLQKWPPAFPQEYRYRYLQHGQQEFLQEQGYLSGTEHLPKVGQK